MTVLVLTREDDATADLVIAELNERAVPVHRLDPGTSFPAALRLTARVGRLRDVWEGTLRGEHRTVDLDHVRSVYYRRPSEYALLPGLPEEDAQWAAAEARAGLGGVLAALDCVVVNRPHRNKAAGVKPVALATAGRCELAVPDTLITNDVDEARAFVRGLPGGVAAYKGLGTHPPTGVDGEPNALWTTQVHAEEITDSVALTAHQFQEWIPKAYEVRVTAVAGQLFAAEIHAGSEASRIDFRTDYDSLNYKVTRVPSHVDGGILRLLDTFKLHYAAMDFLVSQAGDWYLIDLNPNGQWAFIPELRTPITRALADLLEAPL
ncbi:ATP-grasp ribosomal peptide maturase [Streptomyces sp. NPDC051569]|uniref:ATP-grasp ribosomal peptide maturase n=1 Tax=Streptomyces sp. NPDC051569 TaxID=3365661 RepID=UPI0037980D79